MEDMGRMSERECLSRLREVISLFLGRERERMVNGVEEKRSSGTCIK